MNLLTGDLEEKDILRIGARIIYKKFGEHLLAAKRAGNDLSLKLCSWREWEGQAFGRPPIQLGVGSTPSKQHTCCQEWPVQEGNPILASGDRPRTQATRRRREVPGLAQHMPQKPKKEPPLPQWPMDDGEGEGEPMHDEEGSRCEPGGGDGCGGGDISHGIT